MRNKKLKIKQNRKKGIHSEKNYQKDKRQKEKKTQSKKEWKDKGKRIKNKNDQIKGTC